MTQIIRTETVSCFLVGQICILTAKLTVTTWDLDATASLP